jgi:hypothetical protein
VGWFRRKAYRSIHRASDLIDAELNSITEAVMQLVEWCDQCRKWVPTVEGHGDLHSAPSSHTGR